MSRYYPDFKLLAFMGVVTIMIMWTVIGDWDWSSVAFCLFWFLMINETLLILEVRDDGLYQRRILARHASLVVGFNDVAHMAAARPQHTPILLIVTNRDKPIRLPLQEYPDGERLIDELGQKLGYALPEDDLMQARLGKQYHKQAYYVIVMVSVLMVLLAGYVLWVQFA